MHSQLTQQRITDAGGREFRFCGDLYSRAYFPSSFVWNMYIIGSVSLNVKCTKII